MKKTTFKQKTSRYITSGNIIAEAGGDSVVIPLTLDLLLKNDIDKRNVNMFNKNEVIMVIDEVTVKKYEFSASYAELYEKIKRISDKIQETKPEGIDGISTNLRKPELIEAIEETTTTDHFNYADEIPLAKALKVKMDKAIDLECQDIAAQIVLTILGSAFQTKRTVTKEQVKPIDEMNDEEFTQYIMDGLDETAGDIF